MEKAAIVALAFLLACTFEQPTSIALALPTEVPRNATATTDPPKVTPASPATERSSSQGSLRDAVQAEKEARRKKERCADLCEPDYEQICVHDPADPNYRPRTFGGRCLLERHNCEMGSALAVKSVGPCPGSCGERLL